MLLALLALLALMLLLRNNNEYFVSADVVSKEKQ